MDLILQYYLCTTSEIFVTKLNTFGRPWPRRSWNKQDTRLEYSDLTSFNSYDLLKYFCYQNLHVSVGFLQFCNMKIASIFSLFCHVFAQKVIFSFKWLLLCPWKYCVKFCFAIFMSIGQLLGIFGLVSPSALLVRWSWHLRWWLQNEWLACL